ncbi:hypothetical protein RUM43_005070 [Polyplax serrata]|uniref:Fatty acid hydroxylase domain-containing protein n=1 Tax=Polyplax serrata TaxID=468196 RepID=A0AAN8SBL3_POLSC
MSTVLIAFTSIATASVLMTSLLVSPSFRDDTILQMKRIYIAAGEFRQNRWNQFLDIVGDDPDKLWSLGSWIVLMITYWVVGGIYTFFDLTNKPEVLRQYKVQPGTNEPITYKNLFKILGLVLFNQIVVTVPLSMYLGKAMIWRGTPGLRELPPFYEMILHVVLCVLIEEVAFYYSHRLLHHRRIYKYIHKRHHEWTAPISIVALYSNPIEHIFSNVLPVFLGIFILKSHLATAWLWFSLAIAFTLSEHSGYHLPFFPSSEAHDFHHKTSVVQASHSDFSLYKKLTKIKFNNCYGVLGVLDWFHGTDLEFRKTMGFPRHRILLGLDCARKVYPDIADQTKRLAKKKN